MPSQLLSPLMTTCRKWTQPQTGESSGWELGKLWVGDWHTFGKREIRRSNQTQ